MKLYHPDFPDHTADVPDASVDQWTEQGWRKTQPKAADAKTTDTPKGN